ncbi:hypothetical protein N7452_005175 [Penicillium brevicompactum]|uniref:Zn(2)-C6 fungal-type domain-containing protein n=1 Tax=Penicillium brevicompactum TaxID=5074 RepID=A0A9W9QI49_PENBR|nr:hypothetical protein N7452_005175 [Penicillium brevicompactum]
MDLQALRLNAGITKSTNRQGRRPGKSACTACHSRKKRCDAAPPHYQCSFCTKEGQLCIPRDPVDRPARHRILNRTSNAKINLATTINKQQEKEKDTSLPPGIDHEIPRWSAMYSFFSEMQRLLPPSPSPSLSPELEDDDPPAPGGSGEIEEERRVPEGEAEFAKNHTHNPLNDDSVGESHFKGISMPASLTRSASPSSQGQVESRLRSRSRPGAVESSHGQGSSGHVENGRDFNAHGDVFMNDLDSLLRF